jgi:hypothetical protein
MGAKLRLIDDIIAELAIEPSNEQPSAPGGDQMYGSNEDGHSTKPSNSARFNTFYTLSTKERKYIGDASRDADLRPSGAASSSSLTGTASETQRAAGASTQVPSVPKSAGSLAVLLGTSGFLYQIPLSGFETAARNLFAGLDPAASLGDFPAARWQLFLADAHCLVEGGWVLRAEELGWTWQDLFGADDTKAFARIDQAGLALLLDGNRVVAMTGTSATIATRTGGRQTFRRRADRTVTSTAISSSIQATPVNPHCSAVSGHTEEKACE